MILPFVFPGESKALLGAPFPEPKVNTGGRVDDSVSSESVSVMVSMLKLNENAGN